MTEYGKDHEGNPNPIEIGSECPFEVGARVQGKGEMPYVGTVSETPDVPTYLNERGITCGDQIMVDLDGGGGWIGPWHFFEAIEQGDGNG